MGCGINMELTATMTVLAVQPDDQDVYFKGKGTREDATMEEDMVDNSAIRLVRYQKWWIGTNKAYQAR